MGVRNEKGGEREKRGEGGETERGLGRRGKVVGISG